MKGGGNNGASLAISAKIGVPTVGDDFSERGFQQYNMKDPRDPIEYAVDKLDGIVGWPTEFGDRYVRIG